MNLDRLIYYVFAIIVLLILCAVLLKVADHL